MQTAVFAKMLGTHFTLFTEEITGNFHRRMGPLNPQLQANENTEKYS